MPATLEQAIEIVSSLPNQDREKLRKWLDNKDKTEKNEKPNWQIERYQKARKWLDKNSEKYMNQWVCLEGDRLIASGEDGLEVHQKAKEAGIEIPFVHHIVPEIDWGGW